MDQASALPAASCARNPAVPRTSSSCSQSADQSQTGGPPPARSGPQSGLHSEPVRIAPRPSSPALCQSMQRDIFCRIFTLAARPECPAASLRDYSSGALTGLESRAKPGIAKAVGIGGAILFPQQQACHAAAAQFLL